MWGLALRSWRAFIAWERPLQFATVIALAILVLATAVAFLGPPALRAPALLAVFGALVALQLLVMWSLRGMQTTQSLALNAFRQGDYERCRQLLETEKQAGSLSRQLQTLLAFSYKQLGLVAECVGLAHELIAAEPRYFPAWRALGGALLVKGDFAAAAQALGQASAALVDARIEYGLARWLAGEKAAAADEMRRALAAGGSANHRWLARRLLGGEAGEAVEGGAYWQAEAARFPGTAYAAALSELLAG